MIKGNGPCNAERMATGAARTRTAPGSARPPTAYADKHAAYADGGCA